MKEEKGKGVKGKRWGKQKGRKEKEKRSTKRKKGLLKRLNHQDQWQLVQRQLSSGLV